MKKRWTLCVIILAITAFTINETVSFLGDNEKSYDNGFTAGVIDLEVNGQNPLNGTVITIDARPCSCKCNCDDLYHQNITLHMTKDSNPAKVWMRIFNITNHNHEGCSPGFWKNHLSKWINHSQYDTLQSLFDFPTELHELAFDTLYDALEYGGGNGLVKKAKILLRQAAAALLNAAHPAINYPLSEEEIIEQVNITLGSLNSSMILDLKDTLDDYNNLGCNFCEEMNHIEIDLKLVNTLSGNNSILISPDEHKTLSEIEEYWIDLTSSSIPWLEPCINYTLNVSFHFNCHQCRDLQITFDIEFYAEQRNGTGLHDYETSLWNILMVENE